MKYRILASQVYKALKTFPALVVTGPRQSGKTTLLRHILGATHAYANLENPDVRARAREDPVSFLSQFSKGVILDEIQYVPELLPYVKDRIDEKRTSERGRWVLTGSQNFALMEGVSESLAGRAAILTLLPFSLSERTGNGETSVDTPRLIRLMRDSALPRHAASKAPSIAEVCMRGSYPEIATNEKIDHGLWCGSYITTYLERDIRNLSHVGDLGQFERFVRLCATRTGQILNISELARDIGVSVPTAKRWLSLLETGYQILLLYPYYKNVGKRIVKSPKLYFNDTALAAYLLGFQDQRTLLSGPYFPNLFETLIVTDFWKRFVHFGQLPSLYYLRTRDGLEVDLVVEVNQKLHLFEIKSGATITPHHAASLLRAKKDLGSLAPTATVISQATGNFSLMQGIMHWNWRTLFS